MPQAVTENPSGIPDLSLSRPVELLRWIAPSMLTMSALACGLSAVAFAADHDFHTSCTCLIAAAVLDGLDGHTARFLGTSSAFGAELDSVCDAVNFGASPALIMFFWARSLPSEGVTSGWGNGDRWVWWSCAAYAACCACRLSRFNVADRAKEMDSQLPPPKAERRVDDSVQHNVMRRKLYFKGIPAPVGAAYALTPMMLRLSNLPPLLGRVGEQGAWAVGRRGAFVVLALTALMMISPIPTLSSKMLRTDKRDSHLRSRFAWSQLLKTGMFAAFVFAALRYPFELYLAFSAGHLLSLPIGVHMYGLAPPEPPRSQAQYAIGSFGF